MFENGLQYVRVDFHLHTSKDKEFCYSGELNSFANDYVHALKEANINVGVITNHNKFDREEYKSIRNIAKKQDIFILPGVELTIKEGANGIHTLIVFNPDEWLDEGDNHIQSFLTSAFASVHNPENSNSKSIYDLKNTLEKLDAYGRDYFLIFAHVDQSGGLFQECGGGLLKSLAGLAPFRKRVLGLQKSRNRDNIEQFCRVFEYQPALVEGSDPKSILDIGKGKKCTYLKIGEYSYSAIKFALQDYKHRVCENVSDIKHGFIESISFQGGKFDGQNISFSSELNSLIGIRGSGKSSILEAIRYVLGLDAQMDRDYKESLVKNVFGSGGKATLKVVDKHGKRYYISRILGEQTNVFDEDGNDLNMKPTSLFDGIQYFGQKDLASGADHENFLLDKLVGSEMTRSFNLTECIKELAKTVSDILDVSKIPEQQEETEKRRSEISHKLSIFKEKGVADKLKKQGGYTADVVKLQSTKRIVDTALHEIENSFNKNTTLIINALDGYHSEYNEDTFDEISAVLSEIGNQFKQFESCIAEIKKQYGNLELIISRLENRANSLTEEFAEIKREIKDETLDVDSFVRMTADLQKIEDELKQLQEKGSCKSKAVDSFTKATRERNDILLQSYKAYEAVVDCINQNQTELHIEITFKGDRENFKTQMKNDFRGTGISDSKYQVICDTFTDYVEIINDWIIDGGAQLKKILTSGEYAKLEEKLFNQYDELLARVVENKVEIYYHGKLLRQHSIGQRASALILFILTQKKNDIILIDQPEDDLDNKVIYNEVISAIIQKKPDIQFVFATHNANIPVLGDSERVLVVEFQDTRIDVVQGNIDLDATHKQIIDIMEGGKEAFDKRQLVYTSWY